MPVIDLPDLGSTGWGSSLNTAINTINDYVDSLGIDKSLYGISVKDFGALGNGVADDSAAINDAIDAAEATGTSVFLPIGVYLVTAKLSVPSNMLLYGVPDQSIITTAPSSTASPVLLEINSASNVTIRDLIFDGAATIESSFDTLCSVYMSSRVKFDNCRWRNSKGIALSFTGDIRFSGVTNCHFEDCGTWHKTSGSSADRRDALSFIGDIKEDNYGNFVIETTFAEVGTSAITFTNQNEGLLVSNRVRNTYGTAVHVLSSSHVKVVSNYSSPVSATNGNGIELISSSFSVVSANTVSQHGGAGIAILDSTNLSISDNVCNNNNRAGATAYTGGISVGGSTGNSNIVLDGNICTDTQGVKTQAYGIQILSALTNTNIRVDSSNMLAGNLTGPLGPGTTGSVSPGWTPSPTNWGVGSGTLSATWDPTSGRVRGSIIAVFGAGFSATSSAWTFSLPITPATVYSSGMQIGTWTASDSAGTVVRLGTVVYTGTAARLFLSDGTSPSSSVPITWASGSKLSIYLDYTPA